MRQVSSSCPRSSSQPLPTAISVVGVRIRPCMQQRLHTNRWKKQTISLCSLSAVPMLAIKFCSTLDSRVQTTTLTWRSHRQWRWGQGPQQSVQLLNSTYKETCRMQKLIQWMQASLNFKEVVTFKGCQVTQSCPSIMAFTNSTKTIAARRCIISSTRVCAHHLNQPNLTLKRQTQQQASWRIYVSGPLLQSLWRLRCSRSSRRATLRGRAPRPS